MTESIAFAADDLRQLAREVEWLARDSDQRQASFLNELSANEGKWGERSIGQRIAERYVPATNDAKTGLTGLVDALFDAADLLAATAKSRTETENANISASQELMP